MTAATRGSIEGPADWAVSRLTDGIARWILEAVDFFVSGAITMLRTSARPDVEAAWFSGPGSPMATVRNLAAVLLLGFVFLGLLQGLLHGDPGGMATRVAVGLPVSVAGMVVATAVVARLLELTDALSNAVLDGTDEQALTFLSDLTAVSSTFGNSFAVVLVGLVAVTAALILWIELIVRSALIYLLVAISPVAFAATLWPAARGFLRKTLEILLAVIASKFVIALALSIGVGALAGTRQTDSGGGLVSAAGTGVGALLAGAVLLAMAAFAPFLVLKLIPVAEGAMLAQGISHTPARAAQSGLGTYSTVSRLAGGGTRGTSPASPSHGGAALPAEGDRLTTPSVATGGTAAVAASGAMAAGAMSRPARRSTQAVADRSERTPPLALDEETPS